MLAPIVSSPSSRTNDVSLDDSSLAACPSVHNQGNNEPAKVSFVMLLSPRDLPPVRMAG